MERQRDRDREKERAVDRKERCSFTNTQRDRYIEKRKIKRWIEKQSLFIISEK